MIKRIIVAAILIPVVLFIIKTGGWWYRGMITLILAAGAVEFLYAQNKSVGIINTILTIVALLTLVNLDLDYEFNLSVFAIIVMIIFSANFLTLTPSEFYDKTKLIIFALVYLGILGLHFNLLAAYDCAYDFDGKLVIFTLAFSWISDSGAYFIGNAFGKRRLAPVLSPNKTVEGALGGILFSIVFAVIYKKYFLDTDMISFSSLITLSALLSVICPLGDLCASAIKRAANIKNYSQLLPGHGGIIDRLDSLLYTTTFTVFYFAVRERLLDFYL